LKHGRKSSRGDTCCQLFVTDKGFVYVVPMRRKGGVLQAIKQFAKEIGAPDAFIADMSGEQMSRRVKKLCNDIGTALRALEGTPWSNKAELYIGHLKEAARQDMEGSDSPMVFWEYCLEMRARIHNLTASPTSNFLEPLERRETYLTFVDLRRMTGVTTENIMQPFQSKGKC
jgi:hypothetical protein